MMHRICFTMLVGLMVTGCANPLNQVTADRYADTCSRAEASGRMEIAEEACRRALINAQIGHLGAEEESKSLYNYARIKQQLGKVEVAEELLKKSLKLEDGIKPPDQARIGRRLANLAVVVGVQRRFKDAWPYLERLLPLSDVYGGDERQVVKTLFERYAEEYRKLDMQFESAQLQEKAKSL